MSHSDRLQHGKRSAHLGGHPPAVATDSSGGDRSTLHRRHFLEAAGFSLSLAALSGCGRAPVETALPLVQQPAGLVPGRWQQYASTCAGCPAGCGLLVGVRDGRPLKMEGMPEHPLSRGGLCAVGQALPLGLYDNRRLSSPLAQGQQGDWDSIDEAITARLSDSAQNGSVVFVTPTVTSPTLQATIDAFLESFPNARHVVFDPVSSSAILDAHQQTHGVRVLPRYRFERAKVILSLGADFLGTWISPVEFAAGWSSRRVPTADQPQMSYHVQLEGRLSLTGSNADRRHRVAPFEYAGVLSRLADDISRRATITLPRKESSLPSPLSEADLKDLGDRLWDARGECLVVCDSQETAVQRLVNFINHALGNYGRTVDLKQPSRQRQGSDVDLAEFIADVESGNVSALFVAGTDLTQNLPNRAALAKAIDEVPLVVSFAERVDDFASLADFVCPDHHPLEAWSDAEAVSGVISLTQPVLHPLGDTRSILESLNRWMGRQDTALQIIQAFWERHVLPRAKAPQAFQAFWDQAVHDGLVDVKPLTTQTPQLQVDQVGAPTAVEPTTGFCLVLHARIGLLDSRHAHNPWLQELPDPVTKVTWDNYVSISSAVAAEYELEDGDLVRVSTADGTSIELPACIQPGQHDRVLAIALAYGVAGTDRFSDVGPEWLESQPTLAEGELVGKNAARFLEFRDGTLQFARFNVVLEKLPGRRELASTQDHHSLELPAHIAPPGGEFRDVVQETTLSAFAQNPASGKPEVHDFGDRQLWSEDHPKTGHHWGLVIDLNRCTGCSACLIACQSENNVPVVGKDEVRRGREMHWIRIDRYYSGEDDALGVVHQPMMCQHCDNAPCETVCPVLATVHGADGLNQQVYNRCVGTRYCANNCPYKVRRFNWFDYQHDDALQNLALNPDVTVRTRGVMEKCSMCVQRIQEGKLEARRLGQPLSDGAIQTACQQSCPAQAIIFGDMNDPESRLSEAGENPRRFGVLEEFNFRPSVSYLRVVRNRDDQQPDLGGPQEGHHA